MNPNTLPQKIRLLSAAKSNFMHPMSPELEYVSQRPNLFKLPYFLFDDNNSKSKKEAKRPKTSSTRNLSAKKTKPKTNREENQPKREYHSKRSNNHGSRRLHHHHHRPEIHREPRFADYDETIFDYYIPAHHRFITYNSSRIVLYFTEK